MVDFRQFSHDADRATYGQGLDTEPVCYMGVAIFTAFLASISPGWPGLLDVREKRFSNVQIYIVRDDPDHYHMTFRRMRI